MCAQGLGMGWLTPICSLLGSRMPEIFAVSRDCNLSLVTFLRLYTEATIWPCPAFQVLLWRGNSRNLGLFLAILFVPQKCMKLELFETTKTTVAKYRYHFHDKEYRGRSKVLFALEKSTIGKIWIYRCATLVLAFSNFPCIKGKRTICCYLVSKMAYRY